MTPSYPEVAGYTIDEQLLEEPGVGRVFVGRRRGSDALVALKILEAENEDLRRAFLERHEFLTKLDHPNLARTVDAGVLERGSTPWTATAYVPSLTASELLQWLGPLGEEALAVRLCLAVCQGLVHVEEHLGYNGDVRPRNIAITSTGAVLLLDLGFPSIVGGVVMPGAFDYAAPEVLAARIDVDVRADLHALGVCLFMMLTGKNPLSGGLA
ncbi:protein kinase, partial [bacterium]|nr:protein kinase [bacterium]